MVSTDATSSTALLGIGLACPLTQPGLDIGRDLELTPGPNGLDFARVDGMDELVQCLQIALTTALGADVFNAAFGFAGVNAMTGPDPALLVQEAIRIAVIRTLTADSRVARILDLKLLDGRLNPASPPATVEDWRTMSVTVAFETVAGTQATIDIGRLISGG